ncbi:hypothetical protein PSEUBRA_004894 [Kalmanozyma brasiliensis GHG001]|uniref:uncharacterized protein n=1 Tax=Kalmanozyma brasiliensis (strain GHG001) TaxID=1365824 RepID=UPI0028683118|nr:uncharacterized protein PSEUBRA_004894 [Kalmanozyma brasiliensis GHG001]EST05848.2 hypothetical protein PSEUBRA_004894 [Kalmanozyma brasiliensis GHG001]
MTAVRSAVVPSPTTSQPQAASPLNEPPISVAPSPSAASLPNASSAGTSREHHSAKPNLAILAGAILGGLMLLLLIIGAVVYWCGHRKKEATKSKTVRFAKGIGNTSAGPTKRPDSSDYPDDESNHSYHTASQGHQREQPPVAKHEQPPVPVHGAVQIEMPPHHPMRRRIEPLEADQIQLRDREAATIRKPSIEIAEKTADDDDAQIDRCLSYYLKHHRRASNHPDDDIRASLPSQLEMTLSPTKIDAQDRGDRRSLGFPKTGSLFQKIRRSQIRLNEEALFPAKREARHSSRRVSETVDTSLRDTASSSYDPSTPPSIEKVPRINVPLNWRGSSKPHQDERDVQGSPPHSAFEYAYMAGSHRLPFVPDDAEAAWTPPWQDHSPCRSSALSPRRSGPESVRQRSATHSAYRSRDNGKAAVPTSHQPAQQHQQVPEVQPSHTTIATTDVPTSSLVDMLVDETVPVIAPVVDAAIEATDNGISKGKSAEVGPPTNTTAEATSDAASNPTVRKVR